MLDDLKLIDNRDRFDAFGQNEKQVNQLRHVFDINVDIDKIVKIENIVMAGMGGSALAGLIIKNCFDFDVPFEVVRDYQLPSYVNQNSLVIISSYSGNTEETLSALEDAINKNALIFVMASGGKLVDIAEEKELSTITLPKVSQPRYGVFYGSKALLSLFCKLGLIEATKQDEVKHIADWLEEEIKAWLPIVRTDVNLAKKLALDIIGKSVVIYSGKSLYSAAYKWKIDFNENAKHVAWQGLYPEFNHNEFIGWSRQPLDKPYCVVDLISSFDDKRVLSRFELSDKLLSGKRPKSETIYAKGDNLLSQVLWTVLLGDFVSLYVAVLNNVDPSPVELIEKFKKELSKKG